MIITDKCNLLSDLAKMTVEHWAKKNLPTGTYETSYSSRSTLVLIPHGSSAEVEVPTKQLELVDDWHDAGITFRMKGEPTAAEQKAQDEARAEEEVDWEVEDFFSIDEEDESPTRCLDIDRDSYGNPEVSISFTPSSSEPLELAPPTDITSQYWPRWTGDT